MSIYAIVWAYEQKVTNSGQKFTLVTAAQYCVDGDIAIVKQETLANDMSMGLSTVRRHLRNLQEAGIIERTENWRQDGSRKADWIKLVDFAESEQRRKELNRSNRAVKQPSTSAITAQSDQDNRSNRAGTKRVEETLEDKNATRSTARKNGTAPRQQEMERIAAALWEANKLKLNGNEWGFNLTQLSRIYANDEITIDEMERLPEMAVEYIARWKKLDVRKALRAFRADEIVLPKRRRGEKNRGESEHTDYDDLASNR